ncbi:MAG: adenylate/guanylate cyclase domain-containing protein [Bacteroidetes bacterium]|nr:adenylate/guanylate cyclase domain-containing protein [Bacteroidota bacterium]
MLASGADLYLADKLKQMAAEEGCQPAVVQRFGDYLRQAPAESLFPVNPDEIRQVLGLPSYSVTTYLLRAVRHGILDLEWNAVCGMCKGVTHHTRSLGHVHETGSCPGCNVSFEVSVDDNLEVHLSVSDNLADRPADLARISQVAGLSAKDLLTNSYFRRHFSGQVVAEDAGLKIKSVTVLFTDLKKSTELYESIGDLNAYRLVRSHFNIMDLLIENNNGTIVKTIGDAVMAIFPKIEDGVNAAIDIQNHFASQKSPTPLVVKMGLHNGPALVVNLNNRIDYFGGTVNVAARVQGLSKGGDVFISKSVFDDPRSRQRLRGMPAIFKYRAKLKGIRDDYFVYQLNQIPST